MSNYDNITDLLDSIPIQKTPPELIDWSRNVFETSRRYGYKDSDIKEWIRGYAKRKNYSKMQINEAILKSAVA